MENPQLEIGYNDIRGFSDIYVNSFVATQHPSLNWKELDLNDDVPRRVLRLPLYIKAITEWRATPNELSSFLGLPVFPNLFYLALSNDHGDILREAPISPVFHTLLKRGEINLQPGETAFAWARVALFDLASIANLSLYATLMLDPFNNYPGVFATKFSYWKIGTYSAQDIGAV